METGELVKMIQVKKAREVRVALRRMRRELRKKREK